MRPRTSGIVLNLDQSNAHSLEVRVHLVKRGLQNWLRPKYRDMLLRLYRSARDFSGDKVDVLMRVNKPSGDVMLYDEVLGQFVPTGKPGSDREYFVLRLSLRSARLSRHH